MMSETFSSNNVGKMKIFVVIILLISISPFAQAQYPAHNQFKNDLARQKLKGNIRSVTEEEYNAAGDSLKLKSVTTYNDSGNEVSFFTYSPDGALLSKTIFKYNDSGRLTEEDRYKADGSLNVKTTCAYDIKGNKTEEDNYDAGGVLFLKILNKFDGKGNRIVKDSYNEYGSLFLKCNSKFDDDGNEIIAKEYDSHHGLKYTTTYEYDDIDQQGNWHKRTTYKNDDPATITQRAIVYR
jgi:antitoxin component YwqK of YwqJK toxin-antitoxin module